MDAIATTGLTKAYKKHLGQSGPPALNALDLAVHEQEVFGFLGRNGAGKTTTIKILCGLIKPTRGHAEIFGHSVRRRVARTHIGYLPENPYFYEYLTPRETLDFYGKLHGLDAQARAAEWDVLSELLDLRDIADQRVRGFSKGMRQRLGFAVAMVGDPPLLILDEPMSGLDPLGRRSIREIILYLRDRKKTIFFSSHVLGDVEQICDRVGILVQGRLAIQGRIDELLARKIKQVEVIVTGVDDTTIETGKKRCANYRHSEAGHHFYVADVQTANQLASDLLAKGGQLQEFTPIKESLEDYFMRQQEVKA